MRMKNPDKYRWERRIDREPEGELRPGAVKITEHPIGVLIIASLLWISVLELPSTIAFIGASLALGSVIGFLLWMKHR